jgi:hypothetical protein
MATKEPNAVPEVEKVEMGNLARSQSSTQDEEPKV